MAKIIYTHTDEAPLLATYSFLPVIEAFASTAGVEVETRDISLAARILAAFADKLPAEQQVPDALAELGDLFGFVPRQLLAQSSRFRQGEALLAGGFVPAPTITTIAGRLTVEGGIDVKVPMP